MAQSTSFFFGAATALFGATSLLAGVGCGDKCEAFDYAPPSARFTIVDGDSGDPICDSDTEIEATRGRLIPLEDLCEWWLPEWLTEEAAEDGEASTKVTVSMEDYRSETVTIEVSRNGCGEIQQPPLVEVTLEPQ